MLSEVEMVQLEALPLFAGVGRTGLAQVLSCANKAELARGESLFGDGSAPDALFILLSGKADVVLPNRDGEVLLAQLGPGAVVGEISLFIGGDGPASVRAAEPSTLLRFPYAGFHQLMDGDCLPAFRVLYNLAQLLARRLRAADAQLAEMCDPQTPLPAEDDLDRLRRIFFTDWAL